MTKARHQHDADLADEGRMAHHRNARHGAKPAELKRRGAPAVELSTAPCPTRCAWPGPPADHAPCRSAGRTAAPPSFSHLIDAPNAIRRRRARPPDAAPLSSSPKARCIDRLPDLRRRVSGVISAPRLPSFFDGDGQIGMRSCIATRLRSWSLLIKKVCADDSDGAPAGANHAIEQDAFLARVIVPKRRREED